MEILLGPPKKTLEAAFVTSGVLLRGTKELVHRSPGKIVTDSSLCFFLLPDSPRVGWSLLGDELLGMDGGRYLKLDDFKDQDDDFLSPKRTMRDFESGMGTT